MAGHGCWLAPIRLFCHVGEMPADVLAGGLGSTTRLRLVERFLKFGHRIAAAV